MASGQRGRAGAAVPRRWGGSTEGSRAPPRAAPLSPLRPPPPTGTWSDFQKLRLGSTGWGGALPPTLPGGRAAPALPTISGTFRVEGHQCPRGQPLAQVSAHCARASWRQRRPGGPPRRAARAHVQPSAGTGHGPGHVLLPHASSGDAAMRRTREKGALAPAFPASLGGSTL